MNQNNNRAGFFSLPFTASSLLVLGALLVSGQALAQSSATAEPGATTGTAQPAAPVLQKVVVSAAGFEQKITDAPASISVVTADELSKRPYTTLLDAVRDLEGVDIGETRDKTGQGTISLRGMGAEYTLVLIDGRRQNNHGDIYPNNFGGNQFGHMPPLDTIERIEVIRGPASTLYGADALGGVINIITKKVADKWQGSITFGRSLQEKDSFGDDLTTDFNVTGPLIPGTLGLAVRGSIYERFASNPEYEAVIDPAGGVHERTLGFGGGGKTVDNTNRNLGFSLSWTPADGQSLVFDYDTSEQEYDNTPFINNLGTKSYPLGTVDNVDELWRSAPRAGYAEEQRFTRDQWSLSHQGQWGDVRSHVSLQHIATDNQGRTLPLTVEERTLHRKIFAGTDEYAGMSVDQRRALMASTFLPRPARTLESSQYTLDAKVDIPLEDLAGDHLLVVGGQVIDGELEDSVFGMESGGQGAGKVSNHEMYSLFAEDNWMLSDAFTLTAGVRYDDHKTFGSNTSPRLYGVYNLSESWVLKGGISTGYKAPKTTDLYDGITGFGGQGTTPFAGNPELQPETSSNTEVAAYWSSPTNQHNFNITLFKNDFEDKIVNGDAVQSCELTNGVRPCVNLGEYDSLGYTSYRQVINIDKAETQGVELAGRYQLISGLAVRMNYTFTDSEQTSGNAAGQPLTDTAKHMANATLDWTPIEPLNVFLTLEARSKRFRDVDANNQALYYRDYEVLHLGAAYRISDTVTVNARINNLLDEDFLGYQTSFADLNNDGDYGDTGEVVFTDHYNNKDKARNLWVGVNVKF